jgi:hypothetical protein
VPEYGCLRRIYHGRRQSETLSTSAFYGKESVLRSSTWPKNGQLLLEGDIILTPNDQLITQASDLNITYDKDQPDALVVRGGIEVPLRFHSAPTESLETSWAAIFSGAVLQKPHHAVRQQIDKLHSEIYVSARRQGSPATSMH